jgi:hypothetical protein
VSIASNGAIHMDSPQVAGDTVRYRIRVSWPLKKYFLNDNPYVQYTGVDLEQVDRSLLAIPMLSMLAPIAWLAGADLRAPEVDETYLHSLALLKEEYRRLRYPFSFAGNISAEKVVANRFNGSRTGLLFSGGVDSLASYLWHKDSRPDLVSIWGLTDIPHFEKRFWERMWSDIQHVADKDGVGAFQVKTNLLRSINHELLSRQIGCDWFVGATIGPLLVSFCAPLTGIRGIREVIIASGNGPDYTAITGTCLSLDNKVSWADVGVVHDAYGISRQQKLHFLCRDENRDYLSHLRVCWDSAFKTNCGECEKCMRTIAGLTVEGVDPSTCNFNVDEKTFPMIRDCFGKGKLMRTEYLTYIWADIQRHIPAVISQDTHGSSEFLTWLKKYELSHYRARRFSQKTWYLRRQLRYRRNPLPSGIRKLKSYAYIGLSRLKVM